MSDRPRIDLNADAGESFGPWTMGADDQLFASLTSVNFACGFHQQCVGIIQPLDLVSCPVWVSLDLDVGIVR